MMTWWIEKLNILNSSQVIIILYFLVLAALYYWDFKLCIQGNTEVRVKGVIPFVSVVSWNVELRQRNIQNNVLQWRFGVESPSMTLNTENVSQTLCTRLPAKCLTNGRPLPGQARVAMATGWSIETGQFETRSASTQWVKHIVQHRDPDYEMLWKPHSLCPASSSLISIAAIKLKQAVYHHLLCTIYGSIDWSCVP